MIYSKKKKKIKVDFHGNRDLYNFIKQISIEAGRLSTFENNEIIDIIEKYIERNFGGIDYEFDIDFQLIFVDIKHQIDDVKNIFGDFNIKKDEGDKNNGKIKFSSVFLFKKVYNLTCRYDPQYKINNENCERYDSIKCINDNINDTNNSRYLLLEINPLLSSLLYEVIKYQNSHKEIEYYIGSPFIDDNNSEYRSKILSKIQDDAKRDKLIILQNLDQIQPFLYELDNMKYIIKDGQKYSKIYLDNFNGQLTPVHDLFRIIIFIDKTFLDKAEIELLSRFEKVKMTFEQLLDDDQLCLTKEIIEEINLKYYIEQRRINYTLKDLLINCEKEEIEGMIYNIYINYKKNDKEISEGEIKKEVYSRIVKMLCQDIICILPDNHVIKKEYYEEKKYYNFEKYITDDVNKNYKISIIYTFSSIISDIKGANNKMKFMISEIKSENALKYMIDEIININDKSQTSKEFNIMVHFEQIDSNKIQYVSNFIDKYCKEGKYEKYKFIFIIHIERNFFSQNNKTIYSIFQIKQDINQLFIDNLNAPDINLKELMDKDIKCILEKSEQYFDINREFNRALIKYAYKEINNKKNVYNNCLNLEENNLIDAESYIYEIEKYMDKDKDFKNDIIKKVKELINNDDEEYGNCKSLIDKLLQMNYIDKISLDIISYILDYIREEILSKYFEYIFKVLENNNILTALKDIQSSKDNILEENIL